MIETPLFILCFKLDSPRVVLARIVFQSKMSCVVPKDLFKDTQLRDRERKRSEKSLALDEI